VTGAAVYVTASGQLGVLASSERYKTAIASLGAGTDKLGRLRPVSFHLKSDPTGAVQYGLIAEEVDKVYPELVVRDSAGMSQGVRYDELAPLLLSEIQRQRRQLKVAAANAAFQEHRIQAQEHSIEAHQRVIHAQAGQLAEVDARVSELTGRMPEIRGTTTE
jgi:hypothetical protein